MSRLPIQRVGDRDRGYHPPRLVVLQNFRMRMGVVKKGYYGVPAVRGYRVTVGAGFLKLWGGSGESRDGSSEPINRFLVEILLSLWVISALAQLAIVIGESLV